MRVVEYVPTVRERSIQRLAALTYREDVTGGQNDRRISVMDIVVDIVGIIVDDFEEDTADPKMTAKPAVTKVREEVRKLRQKTG